MARPAAVDCKKKSRRHRQQEVLGEGIGRGFMARAGAKLAPRLPSTGRSSFRLPGCDLYEEQVLRAVRHWIGAEGSLPDEVRAQMGSQRHPSAPLGLRRILCDASALEH